MGDGREVDPQQLRVFHWRGTGGGIMGGQKLLEPGLGQAKARDHQFSQFRRRAPADNLDGG